MLDGHSSEENFTEVIRIGGRVGVGFRDRVDGSARVRALECKILR